MAAGLACKISHELSTLFALLLILSDDLFLLFWRLVINIFFREIRHVIFPPVFLLSPLTVFRPRGAFNIPKDGPVLFICGPHANQFLDPLLLFSEVRKEAHRRVAVLTAAKVSSQ